MTTEELHILRHALGLDEDGYGNPYRNHYCAGGEDIITCNRLVEAGLMVRLRASDLTGGSPLYQVTDSGVAVAYPITPRTKPTRYQIWLKIGDAFGGWGFGDWLKAGCPGEKGYR